MASKKHTPPSLTEDLILYEIFPRLPSKSIHRFRCVSTSCRRLPSDPTFLSAVRRITGRLYLVSGRRYLLSFSFVSPDELALFSIDQSGAASPIAGDREPRQNCSGFCYSYAKIINGLMFNFMCGHEPTVSITATNEKFKLPPVQEEPCVLYYWRFFYFCHDPEMDTYKVVSTVMADRDVDDPVIIFTLGADSSWRGYNLQKFKQMGDSKSVCIGGTLYLTNFILDNINSVICAFIVETEQFYAVSYPAGLSRLRYNQCHPIELKGALAVIDVDGSRKCEIKLWVKEKGRFTYGDHESWTELRIDFDPRWEVTNRLLDKKFSFSTNNDGEIVMGVLAGWKTEDGCWIFIYNVDKGEWTTRVEIQGLQVDPRIVYKLFVEEYSESPVSLKQILNNKS